MSFGKRQAEKVDRELRRSDEPEPIERGKIMLIGGVVGAIGLMAVLAFANNLRLVIAVRNAGAADQSATTTKAGAPVVVDKSVTKDEKGRSEREVLRYSDGTAETREFRYSETTGKLDRIVTRARDGKLSFTTFTP